MPFDAKVPGSQYGGAPGGVLPGGGGGPTKGPGGPADCCPDGNMVVGVYDYDRVTGAGSWRYTGCKPAAAMQQYAAGQLSAQLPPLRCRRVTVGQCRSRMKALGERCSNIGPR